MSYFVSPDLSYEALMRLLRRVDKREREEIARASLLYDNSTEPIKLASMNDDDIRSKERCWIPVDITSVIVDKIATALYGRSVSRTTGNAALDEALSYTWRNMPRTMLRVSKVASLVKNDTIGIGIQFPGRVKYLDYGAGNTVPLLDPDDPHGRPIGVIHEYFSDSRDVTSQITTYLTGSERNIKHIVEIITRHQRDEEGNITIPGIHILFEDGKRVVLEDEGYNVLGDFLGCVFWRSSDHPDDAMGRSDVIPLIKTLDGLNDLLCTANEKILWNVHSPIVTNIRTDPKGLRYGPGEMWALSGMGQGEFFKRLESDANISPIMELVHTIITLVHETSRVPSVATGDLEHIGNIASGRAFEIAMIPLSDLMKEKEVVAVNQEIELMAESIAKLAYHGYLDGLTTPSQYGNWLEPDTLKIMELMEGAKVEFEPITYPANKYEEITSITGAVNGNVMSLETGIKELHPRWDEKQITNEVELIDEPSNNESV